MKTILSLATVALMTVTTPVLADTISAEIRFANVLNSDINGAPEYDVQYNLPITATFNTGAELEVNQNMANGTFSLLSGRGGALLPVVLGFNTEVYGEVGTSLGAQDNFGFWGASVNTTRQIYGPVTGSLGYRYRGGFETVNDVNESRINVGLNYAVTDNTKVSATFYRTLGSIDMDSYGLGVVRSF